MSSYIYTISPFLRGLSSNGWVGRSVLFEPDYHALGFPDEDAIAGDSRFCFVPDKQDILDTIKQEWDAYLEAHNKQPDYVYVENSGVFIITDGPSQAQDAMDAVLSGAGIAAESTGGCGKCGITTSWYDRRSILKNRIVLSIGSGLSDLNELLRFSGAGIIEGSAGDSELLHYIIPAIGGIDSIIFHTHSFDEEEVRETLDMYRQVMELEHRANADYNSFITIVTPYEKAPRNFEQFIEDCNAEETAAGIRVNAVLTKSSYDAEEMAKAVIYGWDQKRFGANILHIG